MFVRAGPAFPETQLRFGNVSDPLREVPDGQQGLTLASGARGCARGSVLTGTHAALLG